jgi:hypothetical protein
MFGEIALHAPNAGCVKSIPESTTQIVVPCPLVVVVFEVGCFQACGVFVIIKEFQLNGFNSRFLF